MITPAELHAVSRSDTSRFTLLLADGSSFASTQVVRRVPDRRLVCRGSWNGHTVYAKLFIGKHAERYAARDAQGVAALSAAGIATPALLHRCALAHGAGEALVFAAVEHAVNAEQAWQELRNEPGARLQLATALVREVARHHQAGLRQADLYLRNFLLAGERIHTLDGDAVRPLPRLYGRQRALSNLALLLSKFDVLDIDAWLPELLQVYARARGWRTVPDSRRMQRKIARWRRAVADKYANEKVFRECTAVHVRDQGAYFTAIARPYLSDDLLRALSDPQALLKPTGSRRLKSGNSATVALAQIGERKVVVKRYNIKHFWHGVRRALRTTRAAVSWGNAHRLTLLGIATAAPVALLEKHKGILQREAYFLAEYIAAPNVSEFFADPAIDGEQKEQAATNIARMLYRLYLLQIEHGDFKASNVKMPGGEPWLIDLDGMRAYRCSRFFRRAHVRDLCRLMRNWPQDGMPYALLAAALHDIYKNPGLLRQAGIVTR